MSAPYPDPERLVGVVHRAALEHVREVRVSHPEDVMVSYLAAVEAITVYVAQVYADGFQIIEQDRPSVTHPGQL